MGTQPATQPVAATSAAASADVASVVSVAKFASAGTAGTVGAASRDASRASTVSGPNRFRGQHRGWPAGQDPWPSHRSPARWPVSGGAGRDPHLDAPQAPHEAAGGGAGL